MNEGNEVSLTKKQRRELRRQERLADQQKKISTHRRGRWVMLLLFGLVVIVAGYFIFGKNSSPDSVSGKFADPTDGPDGAPVVIEAYSDFQCPACQYAETGIAAVLEEYPTEVKYVFNDFPLSMHKHARVAAEAAECAFAQGKYWEFHERLFTGQNSWSGQSTEVFRQRLTGYASDLALDQDKFRDCLDGGEASAAVAEDLAEGRTRKVNSTPTFFVNGEKYIGGRALEEWKKIIEPLIEQAKKADNTAS